MLPVAHRLTEGDGFRRAVRSGRRAGTRTLVVHLAVDRGAHDASASSPLIGFVVSKAVGNAVVRNRVKRRLRHLGREHLARLASGRERLVLVVRALPPAAGASYAELGADLDRCLERCLPTGTDLAIPSPSTGDQTTSRTP